MAYSQEKFDDYYSKILLCQSVAKHRELSLKEFLMNELSAEEELADALIEQFKKSKMVQSEPKSENEIVCPKCGSLTTNTVECKKCGIVIAKFLKIQQRKFEDELKEFMESQKRKLRDKLNNKIETYMAEMEQYEEMAELKGLSLKEWLVNNRGINSATADVLLEEWENRKHDAWWNAVSNADSQVEDLLLNRKNLARKKIDSLGFWGGMWLLGLFILIPCCLFIIFFRTQGNIILQFLCCLPIAFWVFMLRSNHKKKELAVRDLSAIELELAKARELSVTAKTKIPTPKAHPESQDDDAYSKIKKLAELRDSGILTEEEFADKKKALLETI